MKPETRTVTQLFGFDVRYVVPLSQRPYVWEQERQWEPLWDDITTLLDHQESANGQHYSHFLGAVVLDHQTPLPGEVPEFTIIDGQQRLTTLSERTCSLVVRSWPRARRRCSPPPRG